MREDICKLVLQALNNGHFLHKFNFTLISLIPKVERPVCMAQFWPIALCNTISKIISKTLALRLKRYLPTVILESQSTFVPKRLITDNIYLHMRLIMYLKVKKVAKKLEFSAKWISIIIQYVESVSYLVMVNGQQSGFIRPEDVLLLGKATIEEAASFKHILATYESWSGQLVNAQKSTILFSPNVDGAKRKVISDMLGMPEVLEAGGRVGSSLSKVFKERYYLSLLFGEHHWVQSRVTHGEVSYLINKEIGVWDFNKVRSLFLPIDCEAILSILLRRLDNPDIMIWKVKVPPKVKQFVYKVVHNRLATVDNLIKRNIKLTDKSIISSVEVIKFEEEFLALNDSATMVLHEPPPLGLFS
ncbi:hypothetical protein LIER_21109 [Lithospermum erythrorhizon]|uniref:Reverse transcriptase zinc-binding domain-containing protein n=1 Tax=Lithospermum erythrorhizon TaxID=34254 RepID=A0AAV3QT41_LITER